MPRISQLPAKTTPASGDEIAIVEVATSTTKKITRADLLKGADLPNDTVTTGAIKNGAVTTNKIAEKAITAPKIDYASLKPVSSKLTDTITLTTTNQPVLTLDISHFPVGSVLKVTATMEGSGTATLTALAGSVANITSPYSMAAQWGRTLTFSETWVKTAAINSAVLQASKDNTSSLTLGLRNLIIERIG